MRLQNLPAGLGIVLFLTGSLAQPQQAANTLSAVRFWTQNGTTRVVLETSGDFEYKYGPYSKSYNRLFLIY